MQDGVIPTSPTAFIQAFTKPLQPTLLSGTPRCWCASKAPPVSAPRCCSWLAKKARNRVPVLAAVQNLLMKKLGISVGAKLQAQNFESYIQLFESGLSEKQA
jgi:hypothetical protein